MRRVEGQLGTLVWKLGLCLLGLFGWPLGWDSDGLAVDILPFIILLK